jgi:hypothetical protein
MQMVARVTYRLLLGKVARGSKDNNGGVLLELDGSDMTVSEDFLWGGRT